MEKFFKKVKTDAKLRKEFFDYMHKAEKKNAVQMKKFGKEFDAYVMSLIKNFAKSKKIAIKDSAAVQKQLKAVCGKIQKQLNSMVAKQFEALLANYKK
ncbi:MAG: hypothetical protein MJ214_00080 [Bacilli bacterium]|nr:hypothetical protein [Bacilli bacterium]